MAPKTKTLRELADDPLRELACNPQRTATYRVEYSDENIITSQRKQMDTYREALAPFADLIPASMHGLPKTTKFAPKLTLEPFLAAHRALYGTDVESP